MRIATLAGIGVIVCLPLAGLADYNSALDNYDLEFTSGGSAVWYEEAGYVRSGAIGDNQSSWLQTTLEGPGELTFVWKVDSGTGCCDPPWYDHVDFLIDGNSYGRIGGVKDWDYLRFFIPPGTHSVTWQYTKDSGTAMAPDAGFLDQVNYTRNSCDQPRKIEWQSRPVMPTPRHSAAAAAGPGGLYVVGGNFTAFETNAAEVFSPDSNSWQVLGALPAARYGLAAVEYRGFIYAIGGRGAAPMSNVDRFEPGTGMWNTPVSPGSLGMSRQYLGAAPANGRIYAVGGDDGGAIVYNSGEEYDPTMDMWNSMWQGTATSVAPMSRERTGLAVVSFNNRVYAIGGRNQALTVGNWVEEYNPVTNAWTTRAPMPTPRSHLAAVVAEGHIFAIGGQSQSGAPLDVVEQYDPFSDEWRACDGLPGPVTKLAAAAIGSEIYVSGGWRGGELADVVSGSISCGWGGKMPDEGKIIVAPNVLDLSVRSTGLRFIIKGDVSGKVDCRIYNEVGAFVAEFEEVTLDENGMGVLEFNGVTGDQAMRGTGVYWLVVRGDGVKDKAPFVVVLEGRGFKK